MLVKSFPNKLYSFRYGIVISTSFNILSRTLVFFNTLLIAYFFGTQQQTDVYVFCNTLLLTIAGLLNGATGPIVREAIRMREAQGEEAMVILVNRCFWFVLLAAMVTAIPLWVGNLKALVWLTRQAIEENAGFANFFRLTAAVMFLTSLNLYLKEVLGIYRQFTLPAVSSILNALMLMVMVLLLHNTWGVKSALLGLLTSNSIVLMLLLGYFHYKLHWKFYRLRSGRIYPEAIRRILVAEVGALASMASGFIPTYLLSAMGTGLLAALNFARQIADMPTQLLTSQFSTVIAIKLNEHDAKQQNHATQESFRRSVEFLLFLLLPFSVYCFIQAEDIITFLFVRGAFQERSVEITSRYLRWFAFLPPLVAIDIIVARLYIAGGRIGQSILYQIAANGVMIATMFFLREPLQGLFLPVALLISYSANLFIQPVLFRCWLPGVRFETIFPSSVRLLALNIIVGFVCYLVSILPFLLGNSAFIRLLITGIIYGLLISTANHWLRINHDVRDCLNWIISRMINALPFAQIGR
jgi:putative peptidoglycan lipid II flippase